jgi:hypothetical protein
MLLRMSGQIVHIAVDVSFADEQIRGKVSDGTRQPQPFSGWLGLIGALDGVLGGPRQEIAVEALARRDTVRRVALGGER